MEINFSFAGLTETLRAMDALPGLLGARVQGDGLIAAANVARREARKLVPVRTGSLQRNDRARRVSQLVANDSRKEEDTGCGGASAGRPIRADHAGAIAYGCDLCGDCGIRPNQEPLYCTAISPAGAAREQVASACRRLPSYATIVTKDSASAERFFGSRADTHHAADRSFVGETSHGTRRPNNRQRNQQYP